MSSSDPSARVAVVTGAARGIGAAIARRLAEDGYDVAALDLDEGGCTETAAAVTGCGRRSIALSADVGDELAVTRAVERIATKLGPPVALVNNAGIQRDRTLSRMTVADWESVMAVHLRGAFLMCRETQRHMREAMWGRIVNISSTAALGNVGQVNYSAAKAGLQGLTRTLAMELGRHNITVNAVAPGFTITDMTRGTADRVGIDFDEMVASQVSQIAVGRAGEPQDIAQAVSFFLDPRSGFVSGQVLYVAGGPRG